MKTIVLFCLSVFLAIGSPLVLAKEIPPHEMPGDGTPSGCVMSVYGDYSYQGKIDPQVITSSWIVLEDQCRLVGPSLMELYYKNPESPCEIPVAVFLVYQRAFIAVAYLYDGGAYLYLLDIDSKCYIGKQLEGDAEPRFKAKLGEALGLRSS